MSSGVAHVVVTVSGFRGNGLRLSAVLVVRLETFILPLRKAHATLQVFVGDAKNFSVAVTYTPRTLLMGFQPRQASGPWKIFRGGNQRLGNALVVRVEYVGV